MAPTLEPGDYLVATRWLSVRSDDLVVFEHPERPGFWLVKRVETVDGEQVSVMSDNPDVTRADSRSFGPVPVSELYRVVLRYWPPRRISTQFPPGSF